MILIITGTNKTDSNSRIIASNYLSMAPSGMHDFRILNLDEIDFDFLKPDMYDVHSPKVIQLQKEYFDPAEKFVFIVPEYNGSYPGVLKLLIDSLEVRSAFKGKKAALIGVATGRAGNLRGMDHLSSVLHHMMVTVMPGSLPISRVRDLIDEHGNITDEQTVSILRKHINRLLEF